MKQRDPNKYPPGLNQKKVARIIRYYDARRNNDLKDDPDHALVREATSWVEVPDALLPAVKRFISTHRKSA